jgi:DNA-directed RNA polymerase specialized sigma24 family protein
MINAEETRTHAENCPAWNLLGQSEHLTERPDESERDLWLYRGRTTALLQRYARCSVEVGRLPSLLGREFFRSRVSSRNRRNFEDVVIFVTDVERALERLSAIERNLLAMSILEEYTIPDIALLMGCNEKTVRRTLPDAVDQLSRILLAVGLIDELPTATRGSKPCQEAKKRSFDVSGSNDG